MTNNDPQQVAREALNNKEDDMIDSSSGGDSNNNDGGNGGGNPLPIVIGVAVLAIALIGVGLFMLFGGFGGDGEEVAEEAPAAEDEAGDVAADTGETAEEATDQQMESTADLALLPSGVAAKGDVVMLSEGSVPVAGGVQTNDDLYLWNGSEWVFVPSLVSGDGQSLMTVDQLDGSEVLIAQHAAPETVIVAADVDADSELAGEFFAILSEVSVGGMMLGSGGAIEGSVSAVPTGGYQQLMHVTNASVIIDQAALSELLSNPDARGLHIQSLANAASAGGYAGINLDYQGAIASQTEQFTAFVQELKTALESQGLSLVVTLATPIDNNGAWDTGGQDWAEVGQIVDGIYAQMPLDPSAYADNGPAEKIMSWAVHQVDRSKLTALVSANAIDRLGGAFRELPLEEALSNMGELQFVSGSETVAADTAVEVALAGNATPLAWDGASLTYQYSYEQDGQTRTVWLNNEASLAYRLRLARKYGVRGAAVRGLGEIANTADYVAAVNSYLNSGDIPQPQGAAITWSVTNQDGGVVASSSGETLNFVWDGSESDGQYNVDAQFAQGTVTIPLGGLEIAVGDVVAEEVASAEGDEASAEQALTDETATEEAATEETTTEESATEEATTEEVATEETTETASAATGVSNGRVSTRSNLRAGPGVIYAKVGEGAEPDTRVEVIGRSGDSLWYQIVLPEGEEAWIYAQLVDTQIDVAALPVPAVGAAATAPVAAASGGTTTAAAPVSAAPASSTANVNGFELGGQTHTLASPALMQYAGMTWVKFQHKWGCGNQPGDLQGRIDSAHANGFKVLLSIPGSPYPSSIDFECYTNFLGGVAALGPDAIEVWNEMNIDFEWPVGQIDPNSYVNNMLIPAYNKIKAANSSVLVISGAPAPTGFFGGGCGATGCDDSAYLAGMAAAGAASYMDCMGVHYNAGATAPGVSSGHPADNGAGHYSWYMNPMINTYYGALGKPLCFTELGYLTSDGYGGLPSNFSWAGNTTLGQHAQWLAEATSIAANSGKVRMVIVFNVDFTLYDGSDPQAGFGMVRKDGSCPACETLRGVMQ